MNGVFAHKTFSIPVPQTFAESLHLGIYYERVLRSNPQCAACAEHTKLRGAKKKGPIPIDRIFCDDPEKNLPLM